MSYKIVSVEYAIFFILTLSISGKINARFNPFHAYENPFSANVEYGRFGAYFACD